MGITKKTGGGGDDACGEKISWASFTRHHSSFKSRLSSILKWENISNPLCYFAISRTYEIMNKQRGMPFYYFICCNLLYFQIKNHAYTNNLCIKCKRQWMPLISPFYYMPFFHVHFYIISEKNFWNWKKHLDLDLAWVNRRVKIIFPFLIIGI